MIFPRQPKRDRGKTRSSSVALLCLPELTAAIEQFLYLLNGNSFLINYVGNVSRLPEVFYKFSNTSFASIKIGSEIMKKSLFSGGERRKRSMAALRRISLINFCKLTQTRKTTLEKKTYSCFDVSSSGFKIWCHND